MAAPTIAVSRRAATLTNLSKREKSKKGAKSKNLLCPELHEWPRPSSEVEDEILSKLTECLKEVPSLLKAKKKDHTQDDTEKKANMRSQLMIGVNSVFRGLERNSLECVLVSGMATPAIIATHVISLAEEKGCPLLCIDRLAPAVADSTDSKCCPLAIGFKKMVEGAKRDFEDVISLILANTSVKTECYVPSHTSALRPTEEPVPGENSLWPFCFEEDKEKEVLDMLVRTFSDAPKEVVKDEKKMQKKKKKKQQKKNLKENFCKSFSHQFEVGKRTVLQILDRGKLQLILVSGELRNVLAAESSSNNASSSLLRLAARKGCLIVCLRGMIEVLKPFFGGAGVAFLGLKKFTSLENPQELHFQHVVDKIKEKLEGLTQVSLPAMTDGGAMRSTMLPLTGTSQLEGSHRAETMSENKTSSAEKMESDEEESKTGSVEKMESDDEEADEEEDYSYLYVLKKDSKELAERREKEKREAEHAKKDASFGTDFISLSGGSQSSTKKPDVPTHRQKDCSSNKGNQTSVSKNNSGEKDKQVPSGVASSENIAISSPSNGKDENFLAFSTSDNVSSTSSLPEERESTPSVPDKEKTVEKNDTEMECSGLPLFLLDRSRQPDLTQSKKGQSVPSSQSINYGSDRKSLSSSPQVLGDVGGPSSRKGEEFLSLSLSSSSKNAKKSLKRKMENDSSFISFAYNETNIKTMVANVDKKRKKKKKK
ncbi:uncharacterized protein LOC101860740 [Aplysia californica]|uniref:Uncharacterized protein LOC101860740 n=1 Tax=Aplysia californica TaxID=6500 RepID=A0ABM0JQI3_APLCA|nr:uncharacterized protein LOC101860740 [Aplysia californica]